jgi:hypothetical protein
MDAQELVNRLLAAGLATPDTILGCSDEEIHQIETKMDVRLPDTYKDFLRVCGKCVGTFRADIDWLYPEVLTNRGQAIDLLQICGKGLALPERAYVISASHEHFTFFDTAQMEGDLPVYLFVEGSHEFSRVAESFWAAIEPELTEREQSSRKYPNSDHVRSRLEEARQRAWRARQSS